MKGPNKTKPIKRNFFLKITERLVYNYILRPFLISFKGEITINTNEKNLFNPSKTSTYQ